MNAERQDLTVSIGLLILRLGAGGYLLTHGIGKLKMLLAGNLQQMGDPIGIGPVLSVIAVTAAEFLAPLLVMPGLATRVAAALVVVSMSVAAFVAHAANPWTMEKGYVLFTSGQAKSWASKEPALLYWIAFLALVFTGAGRFSLDALLRRRRALTAREPIARAN